MTSARRGRAVTAGSPWQAAQIVLVLYWNPLLLRTELIRSIWIYCSINSSTGNPVQVARGEFAARGGPLMNTEYRIEYRKSPLMAIMALLRPGGIDQGLGGGFRWGQRVLRARIDVRNSTGDQAVWR